MLELLYLVSVVKLREKEQQRIVGWGGGKKQWGDEREKRNKKYGVEGAKTRLRVLTEFQIK